MEPNSFKPYALPKQYQQLKFANLAPTTSAIEREVYSFITQ